MAKGDIKAWITVNGRHIPIMEGESKASALANHFKNLKKEHRSKLEKKYNDGQKKVDELRKNLQDAKNSNNAPMTRFYEKKLQDASEEQFKTTNRIADSYRTIKGVNTMGIKKYNKLTEQMDKLEKDKSIPFREKGERMQKLFDEQLKIGRYGDTSKYKLKEDTSDKIKITGRMKTAKEVAKEVKETAIKRMQDAQDKVLDKNYKRIHTYNKNLDKELDKARKENTKDLEEKLGRAIKYQGFVEKNGTSHLKAYKSKELSKTVNQYRNLDNAFKLVYGTDRHGLRQGSEAYKKYLKEHPNSKMKLTTFLKNYDKKK